MKKIELSNGSFALVDDEDYPHLARYRWTCAQKGKLCYAIRGTRNRAEGTQRGVKMHREIMKAPPGIDVDHKDHNGLNNQKSNLRLATRSQNCANSRLYVTNTSGLRGVVLRAGKWMANIKHRGKTIHIGTFDTPAKAAEAYVRKKRELVGPFAA